MIIVDIEFTWYDCLTEIIIDHISKTYEHKTKNSNLRRTSLCNSEI